MALYDSVIPEKLQFFFALSRTHHGVLDMMAPVLAALLYLGQFPDPAVVVVGIMTVFAGYTAVYALNFISG
jgi:4-hydroxybenzoate polyprenyltransferase